MSCRYRRHDADTVPTTGGFAAIPAMTRWDFAAAGLFGMPLPLIVAHPSGDRVVLFRSYADVSLRA